MGALNGRIPRWISLRIPGGADYVRVKGVIEREKLHTVCMEARCPNVGDCFCAGTATFLIMGDVCTRNCRYCAVRSGAPGPADPTEPERVARAVTDLGLRYAVITSVTRDDIPDGGAALFAATVRAIRGISPHCRVEVLIPDFGQSMETSIERVMEAGPDVINHNIETVGSLFPSLRPRGDYSLSLRLLARVASSGRPAKSGLMLGLGESMDQVRATLEDLRRAGCSILTAGQYLRSRRENHPVERFYTPDEFERVRELAESMGFGRVLAGPMVRSSYHAGELSGRR